jgi:TonB family protein
MRRNPPILRHFRAPAVLALAIAIAPLHLQAANDLDQDLHSQYSNKILVLRNFYRGGKLRFDSAGSLASGSGPSGNWTTDGFVRVTSLSLSANRLTVEAERLPVGNNGQSFQFRSYFLKSLETRGQEEARKVIKLRIEVDFDGDSITATKAEDALSHIFLTDRDYLAALVPPHWRPCVLAASGNDGEKTYVACRFPDEFRAIPGLASPPAGADSNRAAEPRSPAPQFFKAGTGTTPPKVVSMAQPEFSDEARRIRYSGVVVMTTVVNKAGAAQDIRIQKPLGFGLDEKAVETVSKWRFKPATKDGNPIDMEIAVEVDFHLY